MILRRHILAAALAPLALALAACGGNDAAEGAAPPSSEPIAAIAPPAGKSWTEFAATTPEGGNRIGNPEAPIRLVGYASHTCSHCADFAAAAAGPLEDYIASGRVSYEIRNQIHDPIDLTIAILVRCGSPETFHPLANQAWAGFEEIITAAQGNAAALDRATQAEGPQRFQAIAEAAGLFDFFAARGISRDQAMQCLSDPAAAERIIANSTTQSDELGVTGTPTFFLNGTRLDASNWPEVEAALRQAGAR